jgi:hypothetical protein
MQTLFQIAAFLLFFPSFSSAIGVYNPGDSLYVHAASGLILRKTPDAKGEPLKTLPYGAAVKVQKTDFKKKPHTVEEFKGYSMRGFWVCVMAGDSLEGYVFDGYLSFFKTPAAVLDLANIKHSIAEDYLLAHSAFKGNQIPLNDQSDYRRLFKNGAQTEFRIAEGGSAQQITFPKNTSLEEAYLIGKALWLKDKSVKSSFDPAKGKITFISDDERDQIEISRPYGFVILKMMHAD